MFFMTLAVVTALCLLIPLARLYGVIGVLITHYFYPYHTLSLLGLLVLAGVAHLHINHRRKTHVP